MSIDYLEYKDNVDRIQRAGYVYSEPYIEVNRKCSLCGCRLETTMIKDLLQCYDCGEYEEVSHD